MLHTAKEGSKLEVVFVAIFASRTETPSAARDEVVAPLLLTLFRIDAISFMNYGQTTLPHKEHGDDGRTDHSAESDGTQTER